MSKLLLGDLLTGRIYLELPFKTASVAPRLNAAGTVEATVSLADRDVRALNVPSAATPGKAFLAWEENDTILEAGPVWSQSYDDDNAELTISGAGLWSYFDRRVVLPPAAMSTPFFINDPNAFDTLIPNTALDTIFVGMSYATMYKRLVQQALSWAGGNVPVVFQPDDVGSASYTVAAVDLVYVGDALRDINQLQGAPDLEFTPRRTTNRLSVEWLLRSGTTQNPDFS